MTILLILWRAFDWIWVTVMIPLMRTLFAIAVVITLLIVIIALCAGLFVAVAKVWP